MNRWETFQSFLTNQKIDIALTPFLVNLVLAAVLAYLLGLVYVRYARTLSNRSVFAANFLVITMTTTLIISIVKSSLALSLGLVGALSIVRFRAAIKEPEELAYLFLAIAIGLGLGADQRAVTVVALAAIAGVIALKGVIWRTRDRPNLYLTVTSDDPQRLSLDGIVNVLKERCSDVDLRRFDEARGVLEASFVVHYDDFEQINGTKDALQAIHSGIQVSFLDNRAD